MSDKKLTTEERKKALRGRTAGAVEPTKATRLRDALPVPTRLTVRGVTVEVHELTLGDLAELDARVGGALDVLASLEQGNVQAMRYIVWLLLRQSEPDLTLEEAGQLVSVRELMRFGAGGLMDQLLVAAGLVRADDPNPPGAEAPPSTGS